MLKRKHVDGTSYVKLLQFGHWLWCRLFRKDKTIGYVELDGL